MIDRTQERTKPIIVTGREYETVWKELYLTEASFRKGTKVLSIGEGLSDFAHCLHQRLGTIATPVDPIYACGPQLFNHDPRVVHDVLRRSLGERYSFSTLGLRDPSRVPLPDPSTVVTADVYHTKFPDKSVDMVVAHQLAEYIDIDQAVQEMRRIVRLDNGEIRFGGVPVFSIPEQKRLLSFIWKRNEEEEGELEQEEALDGLEVMMENLRSRSDASLYVLADHKRRGGGGFLLSSLTLTPLIIIRFDDRKPLINNPEDPSQTLYKVNLIPRQDENTEPHYYYDLEEIAV